ncbi:MAG: hypothetical protein V1789_12725 [PVC group bacterium]
MKKWLIGIGILALIIVAILVLYPGGRDRLTTAGKAVVEVVSLPRGHERSLPDLVPARAGFFFRVRGFREVWEKITGSEFFRELTGSRLWEEEKIEEKLKAFRDEFEDRNGFALDRSGVMELAGEDIILAALPADPAGPAAVVLISRVGLKARLMEVLVRMGDGWQKTEDRILREEEYGGEKVFLISPSESFPFHSAYTFIDDYLVAAVSEEPCRPVIEQVIDLARRGEGKALSDSPEFEAARRAASLSFGESLEWYLKLALFIRQSGRGAVSFSAPGGGFPLPEWGEEMMRQLSAWRTIAGSLDYAGGIRARAVITLEEENVAPASAGKTALGTLRGFAPAGSMIFAEFPQEPSLLWEKVSLAIGGLARQGITAPLAGLRNWERAVGVNVKDDIIPVLDDRWALVSEGITGEEFFPVPPLSLICPVVDRMKAAAFMERIVAWSAVSHNLKPVKEEYHGVEITLLSGLPFLQPAYALTGDYLIVGSSRDLLTRMIDVRSGSRGGIGEDSYFREVVSKIGAADGGLIYLNGEQLVRSLISLGKWYFPYQRMAPEEPILPEEFYRNTIAPLLRLCAVCKAAGIGITREKNLVREDCFIYIQ